MIGEIEKRELILDVYVQREDLRRVMELLSLREHHARTLLIHHRWDVEKLIAVLVEKGKACLFMEAGVSIVEHHDLDVPPPTVMCDICIEDVPSGETTKMECGHRFCNSCKWLCLKGLCFYEYYLN